MHNAIVALIGAEVRLGDLSDAFMRSTVCPVAQVSDETTTELVEPAAPRWLVARPALRSATSRWAPYPIAPLAWCADGETHHDPDLLLYIGGGLNDSHLPTTALPIAPRRGVRIILLDVRICSQANLDRRYVDKSSQLDWITRTAHTRDWNEVTISRLPVAVAMTSKLHVILIGMERVRSSRLRAFL